MTRLDDDDEPATDSEPERAIDALVEDASPVAGLAARQSLATLEAKLFGRKAEPVTVSRYVLVERIASGGGGTVYRAYDPKFDRKVALKLLHAGHDATGRDGRARLLREAQSLAKLSHPNIVKVYDVGTYDAAALGRADDKDADAGVFVAMEFVEGVNLALWLADRRRSWREVRDVFVAAARGLAAAHARGIVHRDFKPANVLVGQSDASTPPPVKVLDFGLARVMKTVQTAPHAVVAQSLRDGLEKLAAPMDVSLTMTGAMLGTPAYMAPEQHARQRADARCDQYSLCLAMYEGLYGCSPFSPGSPAEVEDAKRRGDIQPPPKDAKVPAHFEAVLRRGLSAQPESRWPDMDALIEQLQAEPRTHRRWIVALAAGSLAAGAGATSWWQLHEPTVACDDTDQHLGATWGDDRKEAMRVAFSQIDRPYADEAYTRASMRIDAYADAWVAAAVETCEATQVLDDPDELLAMQEACLQSRLDHLDALIDALVEADAAVAEHAVDAVSRLPPLDPCLDHEAIASRVHRGSPRASAEAPALRGTLVEAAVSEWTGDPERAVATASKTADLAKAAGDPEIEIEALFRRGSAQANAGRLAEAEHDLSEALWSAAGMHHDEVAAAAARRLVQVVGRQHGRSDDGHLWARHARASSANAALGVAARAALEIDVAQILADEGQLSQALVTLDRASQLLEDIDGPTPVARVDLATVRGDVLQIQGRVDAAAGALGDATELAIDVYGKAHPKTAQIQRRLADALHRNGRAREALTIHERALATLDAADVDDTRRVPSWLGLGEVHLSLEDADAAAESFGRALSVLGEDGDARRVADARFGLARALRGSHSSTDGSTSRVDERSTRLAAQARDTYELLGDRDALARVEAWLAARPR